MPNSSVSVVELFKLFSYLEQTAHTDMHTHKHTHMCAHPTAQTHMHPSHCVFGEREIVCILLGVDHKVKLSCRFMDSKVTPIKLLLLCLTSELQKEYIMGKDTHTQQNHTQTPKQHTHNKMTHSNLKKML